MKNFRNLTVFALLAMLSILVFGSSAVHAKDQKFKLKTEKSCSATDEVATVVFLNDFSVAELLVPTKGTTVYLRSVPCRGPAPVVAASMNSPPNIGGKAKNNYK